MEMETEAPIDLIAALQQATLMANQLPTTTNPSHLLQIHTALRSAHHHLSLFLSNHHSPPPPHPLPTPLPEKSVSSAVGDEIDQIDENRGGEPMQIGDEEDEQSSRAVNVDKVEWKMRECFIQNKRPKRQLSPSAAAAAEQRRRYENKGVRGGDAPAEFEPLETRLRSLDLIYQFHA